MDVHFEHGWFFLCGSVIWLFLLVMGINHWNRLRKSAPKSDGVVVDFTGVYQEGEGTQMHPVIQYSRDGQTCTFVSSFYRSNAKMGEKVKVAFDPTYDRPYEWESGSIRFYVFGVLLCLPFFLFGLYVVLSYWIEKYL